LVRRHVPAWFLLVVTCASCGGEAPEVREARALLDRDRAADAYELLEDTLEKNPDSPERLVVFAEACQRLGRVRRGVRAVEAARALDADSPRVLYVSALLDRDRHRFGDAIGSVRRAIEHSPRDVDFRVLLGQLLLVASDHAGAVDAFTAAHELAPDDLRAMGGRGQALVLVGRNREGEPLLERYLEREPNDGQVVYLRGLARLREERFEEAEEDFRRAIAITPWLPAPYHNLARILQATGREEEAASMRERHLDVNERDWAIRDAEAKVADDPNDETAVRELARLLRQAGRNAEAAVVAASLASP